MLYSVAFSSFRWPRVLPPAGPRRPSACRGGRFADTAARHLRAGGGGLPSGVARGLCLPRSDEAQEILHRGKAKKRVLLVSLPSRRGRCLRVVVARIDGG